MTTNITLWYGFLLLFTPIRDKQYFFFLKKSFNKSLKRGLFFCIFTIDYQSYNKRTILMKLVSKVTEIYCIADDFCKEYHLELNKTSLSPSSSSANSPKHRKRRGRMSDAEMITILITPIRFIRQISFASFSEHLQIHQYL